MTQSHRFASAFILGSFSASLLFLAGCTTAKSPAFRNSFLPPSSPRVDTTESDMIGEPPAVPAELYMKERPNALPAAVTTTRNADIDNRLRRAEEHFSNGQRAYGQGSMDEARYEFNRAVDLLLMAPDGGPDRLRVDRRLDQMVDAIYRYDVNGMGSGEDADKVVYAKSPLDDILEMTFPVDPRLKSQVKEEIAATSSQLPLEANDAVLSYIHFFTTERGKKMLAYGLKRSGKYRPMVQRILDNEGVPQELIYLAQIESAFQPRAISRRSCVGVWQFSVWDGKNRGLEQNASIDQRMDPEKATKAAAKHLHELYNQFGDWYLAMAAYNCGPACVDRAVQRTGYADFWRLRELNALPAETANYVPVILAITIIAKNPKDYGLDQIEFEAPLEYETVRMEAATNLGLIADALERPISEIRDINPAILKGVAPIGSEIHVPKGMSATLNAALETVPATRRAGWRIHKVSAGETLAVIAKRYGTAPTTIAAANAVGDGPSAGDVLLIPASYEEKSPLAPKASKYAAKSTRGQRTSAATPVNTARRRNAVAAPPVANRKAVYTKHVPQRVLHKKATVKTAGLH